MNKLLHIIPLRVVQHSDRTSFLQAYSRENGAISFSIPAGSGPGAARRRALLRPLTPLEVEANLRPGRELHTFREPRALLALHGIMADPMRGAMAMFMAEALQIILRQGEADPNTYDYICESVARLNDPSVPVANFHLAFLNGLSTLLGIAPDRGSYRRGMVFDMLDGCFRTSAAIHGHTLDPDESAAAATLMRLDWRNQGRVRMSAQTRSRALERFLEYFTLHYANLAAMKSPGVLHSVMKD